MNVGEIPTTAPNFYPRQTQKFTMYKIYYSDDHDTASAYNVSELKTALSAVEALRQVGYKYVTLVSDYADMVGKPGVQAAGSECVPQLLNP